MTDDWKRYPHVPDWGDPDWFTFPTCDGDERQLGMQTYFLCGFLRGRSSGRRYAFLTVFTDARILERTLRFSFYSLALFDCDRRHYGTGTDFDWPGSPSEGAPRKLSTAPKHLGLRYEAPTGARMGLVLTVEAARPPAPLGGRELGGAMMFLGAERTYSYFQSGLDLRGRLSWGDVDEEVEGNVGWIDRQWAEDDFSKHQDPESSRYRNEWRVMLFDNGWDMSCFHQYQRDQRNAVVPWTGISAQGPPPAFELRSTHRVELAVPGFIRSPGIVRAPMMLTEGPRYFPNSYRLRVPEWEMDVRGEPFVDAPAHLFPIEWWSGPVRIEGRLFGEAVKGLGFDERSSPRIRGFEIAEALKLTAENADGGDADLWRRIAYRAWEVEALALRGDAAAAARHLEAMVMPLVTALPSASRAAVSALCGDLLEVLRAGG